MGAACSEAGRCAANSAHGWLGLLSAASTQPARQDWVAGVQLRGARCSHHHPPPAVGRQPFKGCSVKTVQHAQRHSHPAAGDPPSCAASSDQLAPLAGVTRVTAPLARSTATTASRLQGAEQTEQELVRWPGTGLQINAQLN